MALVPSVWMALALLASPAATTLGVEALARSGVPALSRTWTGDDYLQFASAVEEGRIPLPRVADPAGPAVLARLVAAENLEPLRSPSLPIESRMPLYVRFMQGMGPVLGVYLKGATGGPVPHEELARLLAYLMEVAALGAELMDEFRATVPRDAKYPTRVEGLRKMRSGLTNVLMGCETSLREAHYTAADRATMLGAMAAALPRFAPVLDRDVVIDLRLKLEQDRKLFSAGDAARLEEMIALLAAREKAPDAPGPWGIRAGDAVPPPAPPKQE